VIMNLVVLGRSTATSLGRRLTEIKYGHRVDYQTAFTTTEQ